MNPILKVFKFKWERDRQWRFTLATDIGAAARQIAEWSERLEAARIEQPAWSTTQHDPIAIVEVVGEYLPTMPS